MRSDCILEMSCLFLTHCPTIRVPPLHKLCRLSSLSPIPVSVTVIQLSLSLLFSSFAGSCRGALCSVQGVHHHHIPQSLCRYMECQRWPSLPQHCIQTSIYARLAARRPKAKATKIRRKCEASPTSRARERKNTI